MLHLYSPSFCATSWKLRLCPLYVHSNFYFLNKRTTTTTTEKSPTKSYKINENDLVKMWYVATHWRATGRMRRIRRVWTPCTRRTVSVHGWAQDAVYTQAMCPACRAGCHLLKQLSQARSEWAVAGPLVSYLCVRPLMPLLACTTMKGKKKKKRSVSAVAERESRFETSICVARQREPSTGCAKHISPVERWIKNQLCRV